MTQEMELENRSANPAVRVPVKSDVTDANSGMEVARNISIAIDGRKRSKFHMAAIITALFVRRESQSGPQWVRSPIY